MKVDLSNLIVEIDLEWALFGLVNKEGLLKNNKQTHQITKKLPNGAWQIKDFTSNYFSSSIKLRILIGRIKVNWIRLTAEKTSRRKTPFKNSRSFPPESENFRPLAATFNKYWKICDDCIVVEARDSSHHFKGFDSMFYPIFHTCFFRMHKLSYYHGVSLALPVEPTAESVSWRVWQTQLVSPLIIMVTIAF